MKKVRLLAVAFVLFCGLSSLSYGQTTMFGGRGMLRVFSASTIQPGAFHINSYFLTFLNNNSGNAGLGKDYTLNFGLTYGLSRYWELTAQVVAYQDDQAHVWGPPGDMQVGAKFLMPFSKPGFMLGLRGYLSLPTATNHNVQFEPFSSDKVAWGVSGLITLDMTNTFPLFPLKINANVGYLDHNISTLFQNEVTDQLILGFGFKWPLKSVIMYTEYTGEIFFNASHVNFGNNSMRITQGLQFVGPLNLVFDFAADIGLSKNLDSFPVHEYADWKIIAGLNYQFISNRSYKRANRVSRKDRTEQDKQLEKIKEKRENVDEDLGKMRKDLEDKPEKP